MANNARFSSNTKGLLSTPFTSVAFSIFSNGQGNYKSRSRNNQVDLERRYSFKKEVICYNCGKEGHIREYCYKQVGYPVGHSLYGKYQFPSRFQRQHQVYKQNRTVNMASTQEEPSVQNNSSQNA